METNTLGKLIIALTKVPQYWALLLDVVEKLAKPDFASELGRFARRETCWVSNMLRIKRNRFNPSRFVGEGWSILYDETDARSIALTELDPTKIRQVTMLKHNESRITGEERLKRLKASSFIRLDADIFLMFLKNQHLIPESWKEKVNGNTHYISFDGTIFQDPSGKRYVLYLYWLSGRWYWNTYLLDNDFDSYNVSATLAS